MSSRAHYIGPTGDIPRRITCADAIAVVGVRRETGIVRKGRGGRSADRRKRRIGTGGGKSGTTLDGVSCDAHIVRRGAPGDGNAGGTCGGGGEGRARWPGGRLGVASTTSRVRLRFSSGNNEIVYLQNLPIVLIGSVLIAKWKMLNKNPVRSSAKDG